MELPSRTFIGRRDEVASELAVSRFWAYISIGMKTLGWEWTYGGQ